MSAPFRAQAFGRVVLLQTAAEWAETTDKVLQDYETGRETDTGYEKTGDGVSTWAELAYDDPTPTPGGVKVYAALLTQSSVDAPTATVLQNTLGENPTFSYENTGVYAATFPSPLLPAGKTSSWMGVAGGGIDITKLYNVYRDDNTLLFIRSYNGGTPADNLLTDSYVEILVYP